MIKQQQDGMRKLGAVVFLNPEMFVCTFFEFLTALHRHNLKYEKPKEITFLSCT